MPSPIAHLAVGFAIDRLLSGADPQPAAIAGNRRLSLLLAAGAFSLLPDVDLLPWLAVGKRRAFHRHLTHTLLCGIGAALVASMLARVVLRHSFRHCLTVTGLAYTLHLVLDCFTPGTGVMLFWPFDRARYRSPIPLFYGFLWSRGLFTPHHLLTALSELGFSLVVWRATTRRAKRC